MLARRASQSAATAAWTLRRCSRLYSSGASAYLSSQAESDEIEDAELRASRRRAAALVRSAAMAAADDPPWDGDESLKAALTRLLQDQYKPLRVPGWEKEVQQPTKVAKAAATASNAEGGVDGPPPPWLTVIKPPSFATAAGSAPIRAHRSFRKGDTATVESRLTRAKDASVSYQQGDFDEAKYKARLGASERARRTRHEGQMAASAVAMGARRLDSLIDQRLESARAQGLFRTLRNRGKPIPRDEQESNPYISRQELILNRMVQRQGAAPPFVEAAIDMQQALDAFRTSLRGDWTRRAVRMLCAGGPITPATITSVLSYRDPEWVRQQRAYHSTAVKEVNKAVGKFNALAPFSARKPIIVLERELSSAFTEATPLIQHELKQRLAPTNETPNRRHAPQSGHRPGSIDAGVADSVRPEGILAEFVRALRSFWQRWS